MPWPWRGVGHVEPQRLVAGAAGGYLIGNMMDTGAPFMDTPTKLAVATLSGAVGFGLATQVCAQAEVMSGNADVSVNI